MSDRYDFTTEALLKAGSGFQMPKMAAEMRIVDRQPANVTNGAFWEHKGSAPLVGGGKISVKYVTGPGHPADPVWTITKPSGEKTVIHGLGIKDGKPSGDKFTATTTKPNGEKQTIHLAGGKMVGGGKHPFHGNQFTAHGTDVPVKGAQPTKKSLDFTTNTLLKGF
jgi:hypothetical protein